MAGPDRMMTTSALLRHGFKHMRALVDGLSALLAAREIDSLANIRSRMSQRNLKDTGYDLPTAERALYDAPGQQVLIRKNGTLIDFKMTSGAAFWAHIGKSLTPLRERNLARQTKCEPQRQDERYNREHRDVAKDPRPQAMLHQERAG